MLDLDKLLRAIAGRQFGPRGRPYSCEVRRGIIDLKYGVNVLLPGHIVRDSNYCHPNYTETLFDCSLDTDVVDVSPTTDYAVRGPRLYDKAPVGPPVNSIAGAE